MSSQEFATDGYFLVLRDESERSTVPDWEPTPGRRRSPTLSFIFFSQLRLFFLAKNSLWITSFWFHYYYSPLYFSLSYGSQNPGPIFFCWQQSRIDRSARVHFRDSGYQIAGIVYHLAPFLHYHAIDCFPLTYPPVNQEVGVETQL